MGITVDIYTPVTCSHNVQTTILLLVCIQSCYVYSHAMYIVMLCIQSCYTYFFLPIQNSVSQFYFLSCSGSGVTQEGMAGVQCVARNPVCLDNPTLNVTAAVNQYVAQLNIHVPHPATNIITPSPTMVGLLHSSNDYCITIWILQHQNLYIHSQEILRPSVTGTANSAPSTTTPVSLTTVTSML